MKITAYYCKALKDTGKPIVIIKKGKKSTNTNKLVMKNINIKMKFNNARGKAKKSGATTVLEITTNESS